MPLPRVVVTGSSGFIGRHLIDELKDRYEIIGMARRSQLRCGAPFHANIHWYQVDVAERNSLKKVFEEIKQDGDIDYVIHLAAHYDFTGDPDPEYHRTNVDGLRNVLEQCKGLDLRRFIFSSSLAACSFPPPGEALDETTPPDGDHIYARSKAIGERMLREYDDYFPSTIIRFAALFSDWCEYPPLYMFIDTWLAKAWNSRVLGGHGESAIPYLHVHDSVRFIRRLLIDGDELEPGQIVIASVDGSTSHRQLYFAATHYYFEDERSPIYIPKPLVKPGILMRNLMSKLTATEPFERPWMADYVDKKLTTNAASTRKLLNWRPRSRLEIIRRIPFLLENYKGNPVEWTRRNRDAMKRVQMRPNLKIHSLLEKHAEEISRKCTQALQEQFGSYGQVDDREHRWNHRLFLRQLMNAVRTNEKADFLSYCRDLAERRAEQGFTEEELGGALEILNHTCVETLMQDEDAQDVTPYIYDHVTLSVRFGCDQIMEYFENLREKQRLGR